MKRYGFLFALVQILLHPSAYAVHCEAPTAHEKSFLPCYRAIAQEPSADRRLQRLVEFNELHRCLVNPNFATITGLSCNAAQDHFTDFSLEAITLRHRELELEPLEILKAIDPNSLSSESLRETHALLRHFLEGNTKWYELGLFEMPLTPMIGVLVHSIGLIAKMPTESIEDYEVILKRMGTLGLWVDQTIALMRSGIQHQRVLPRIVLTGPPGSPGLGLLELSKKFTVSRFQKFGLGLLTDGLIFGLIQKNPILSPFQTFPKRFSPETQKSLKHRAVSLYLNDLIPAYNRLYSFLENEYLPKCRDSIEITNLPRGDEIYQFMSTEATTSPVSAHEIHEIGRAQVNEIRARLAHTQAQVAKMQADDSDEDGWPESNEGGFSDFSDFSDSLLNPALHSEQFLTTAEQVEARFFEFKRHVQSRLPNLFGRTPQADFRIAPMPPAFEKIFPAGLYLPGSLAEQNGGAFYFNGLAGTRQPVWKLPSLFLHEAIPGHHLQFTLAQENPSLPKFRRIFLTSPDLSFNYFNAFVEGWALYAEGLGEQMDLYRTPLDQLGADLHDMQRALRLVLDTGIHLGIMSYEEALDYGLKNSGLSREEIEKELLRYIYYPGQALGYKMGEMKFLELRELAKRERGPHFDLRTFHDELHRRGPLPLTKLEEGIRHWASHAVH